MRTPRTATVSGQDRIMQQARDASRLQQGQTPLLGGENVVQIERGDFGNSVAPPTVGHATPHPLLSATPGATPRAIAGVSSTPSVAGTPLRTPGKLYAEPVFAQQVKPVCSASLYLPFAGTAGRVQQCCSVVCVSSNLRSAAVKLESLQLQCSPGMLLFWNRLHPSSTLHTQGVSGLAGQESPLACGTSWA